MTKEQLDFLAEFKRQAMKYLIGYFFVSLGLVITFYIDTKIEIGKIKADQEQVKATQTENCRQIGRLIELHLNR